MSLIKYEISTVVTVDLFFGCLSFLFDIHVCYGVSMMTSREKNIYFTAKKNAAAKKKKNTLNMPSNSYN